MFFNSCLKSEIFHNTYCIGPFFVLFEICWDVFLRACILNVFLSVCMIVHFLLIQCWILFSPSFRNLLIDFLVTVDSSHTVYITNCFLNSTRRFGIYGQPSKSDKYFLFSLMKCLLIQKLWCYSLRASHFQVEKFIMQWCHRFCITSSYWWVQQSRRAKAAIFKAAISGTCHIILLSTSKIMCHGAYMCVWQLEKKQA